MLWEGDYNVSWELPEGNANREWKELGQSDFAALPAGQIMYFYFNVDTTASYHKYNFDSWGWAALPGHEAEHAADFGFGSDTRVTFELTQAIKDTIASLGFAIHGHGFHVMKVSVLEADSITPVEPDTTTVPVDSSALWQGRWYVSWDSTDPAHKEWKELGQSDFADFQIGQTLSFFLEADATAEYHKYKIDDWSWNILPGQVETEFANDTVVTLEVTQAVKTAVATGGFAVHGHGFYVTKVTISQVSTALEVLPRQTNGVRYNLLGQPVDETYRGVVVIDGKKLIVR